MDNFVTMAMVIDVNIAVRLVSICEEEDWVLVNHEFQKLFFSSKTIKSRSLSSRTHFWHVQHRHSLQSSADHQELIFA